MTENIVSPIAKLVDYPNKKQPHWEGQLSIKVFFNAYWTKAWTKSSIFQKVIFILMLYFILFAISIPIQFLFKKTYCYFYNLKHKPTSK